MFADEREAKAAAEREKAAAVPGMLKVRSHEPYRSSGRGDAIVAAVKVVAPRKLADTFPQPSEVVDEEL